LECDLSLSGDKQSAAKEVSDKTSASAANAEQVKDFDFFGNPITPQSKLPVDIFSPTHEDYSEFLEVPRVTSKSTSMEENIKAIERRGCVGEFGRFILSSICCTTDSTAEGIPSSDIAVEELASLNNSGKNAKAGSALLQSELKSHLNRLKRQNYEVEESYKVQIATELSRKTMVQAQLQDKLMKITKERMEMEMQLQNAQQLIPSWNTVQTPSPESTITSPVSRVPKDSEQQHKLKCMPKTRPVTNLSPFGLSIVVENQSLGSPGRNFCGTPVSSSA